jgi:hypothetical protein
VRKRPYSNLFRLHPLNSTPSKLPTPSSSLCLVGFLFLTDWFRVWYQKELQEGDPFILLFLFHYCFWLSFIWGKKSADTWD